MTLAPGKYKAKVHSYAIRPIKTGPNMGQPAATIKFITEDEKQTVYWQGTFAEKSKKFTFDALYHCGLESAAKIADLALGASGGALDLERVVEIDVVNEVNQDGQPYAKVSWINPEGGMGFQNVMQRDEFAAYVSSLGLTGAFLEIAEKYKIISPKKYDLPKQEPKKEQVDLNEIPF